VTKQHHLRCIAPLTVNLQSAKDLTPTLTLIPRKHTSDMHRHHARNDHDKIAVCDIPPT